MGYIGWSRSRNSQIARDEGKMTATDFAKFLNQYKKYKGCTSKYISICMVPCEWHHTSKYYRKTNYYDPRDLSSAELRLKLQKCILEHRLAKSGKLLEFFRQQTLKKGLKLVETFPNYSYHAVDDEGIVHGWCRLQDGVFPEHTLGIGWHSWMKTSKQ